MKFKISFTADEDYFKETYKELIGLTAFNKHSRFLGICLIVLGIELRGLLPGLRYLALLVITTGIYSFCWFYYAKYRWFKNQAANKIKDKVLEMEFRDDIIKQNGPFSKAELKWDAFKAIQKTEKGIVFRLENGTSIYLPDKVFQNQKQIDFILGKDKL